MLQSHKTSFLIILSLIFISPLFFIPGGALSLASAKSIFFSVAIISAVLVFLYESYKEGNFTFPKHPLLMVVALLPAVYFLSALLSATSSLSLLGYNLEVGTFGFILLGAAIFFLASIVFSDHSRILQAVAALLATLSVLVLFAIVKIISGGKILVLGNFIGNISNPLGNWTDLSVVFGLLAALIILAIGMIPMKFSIRAFLYVILALATILLMLLNFFPAFILTLIASVLTYLYLARVESHFYPKGDQGDNVSRDSGKRSRSSQAAILSIVLAVISLLFLINPTISASGGKLADVISNAFNISNIDVRPTLGATLSVSKAVLTQLALLGSGPNTFSHDWLVFKPVNVNTTPFWSVAFPYGIGFIPTQIASTGILGSALWVVFLALILALGFKVFNHIPDSRALRFALASSLMISVFLWTASFLYTPSMTLLILAFLFSGILVAISHQMGIVSSRTFDFKESPSVRVSSTVILAVLVSGALYFGWLGVERAIASYYFTKATSLSNTPGIELAQIEDKLNKAVKFSRQDIYYVAISRLNFSKAQLVASSATPNQSASADGTGQAGTLEEQQKMFQDALGQSIAAAKAAVSVNPAGYENWVTLGSVYSALVPAPLKVEGAYENAKYAFNEALKRNPNNPQVPLLLAQLEINKGNIAEARSYLRNAIALKEDYADAYLSLAQLEIQEKNIPAAINSTTVLAQILPNNAGVHFELGVLKYSNEDYNGALESLARAVEISPDYADAKYYQALSLTKLGRKEEARTILEELLNANPDNEQLKALLQDLDKKK